MGIRKYIVKSIYVIKPNFVFSFCEHGEVTSSWDCVGPQTCIDTKPALGSSRSHISGKTYINMVEAWFIHPPNMYWDPILWHLPIVNSGNRVYTNQLVIFKLTKEYCS